MSKNPIGYQIVETGSDNPPEKMASYEIYTLAWCLSWIEEQRGHGEAARWRLLPIYAGDVEEPVFPEGRNAEIHSIDRMVADVVNAEGTDEKGAIRDVLTDAMHWCKANGIDFSERMLAAAEVFGEEERDAEVATNALKEIDSGAQPLVSGKALDVALAEMDEPEERPEVGYCRECDRTHVLGICPPPDRDPDMP